MNNEEDFVQSLDINFNKLLEITDEIVANWYGAKPIDGTPMEEVGQQAIANILRTINNNKSIGTQCDTIDAICSGVPARIKGCIKKTMNNIIIDIWRKYHKRELSETKFTNNLIVNKEERSTHLVESIEEITNNHDLFMEVSYNYAIKLSESKKEMSLEFQNMESRGEDIELRKKREQELTPLEDRRSKLMNFIYDKANLVANQMICVCLAANGMEREEIVTYTILTQKANNASHALGAARNKIIAALKREGFDLNMLESNGLKIEEMNAAELIVTAQFYVSMADRDMCSHDNEDH